jgi:signal transduction histidine kinase
MVRADIDKAQQILLNLLGNAIKFTPAGGTIAVSGSRTADYINLEVRDTGIGIPVDQLESIFQPFVQVDGGAKPATKGSGLGLTISRDLARGMGGDLFAASALGEGSTFTLRLAAASAG